MTADELLRLNVPDARTELVRGELVVREPAGYRHGNIAARLLVAVGAFVEARGLGWVFTAETGFRLRKDPDTVHDILARGALRAREAVGRQVDLVRDRLGLVCVRTPDKERS